MMNSKNNPDEAVQAKMAENLIECEKSASTWFFNDSEYGSNKIENHIRSKSPLTEVSWVFSCINKKASAISQLDFYHTYADGEGREIQDGRLSKMILAPNDYLTWRQMISGIVFYLDLYGEAFWAVDIDDQLLPINPGSMEERISKSGRLLGWRHNGIGGSVTDFSTDEIIQWKIFNPSNPYRGLSPILSGASAIDNDFACSLFAQSVMSGGGAIGGVYYTDFTLQPPQRKEIEKVIARHRGANNAGKALVLHSGLKYSPKSWSPKELDINDQRRYLREEICSVFGVPPIMVGILENSSYANADAAQRMFWTDTIQPLAINIADILTLKLCPPGTKIAIDSSKIGALNESLERKLDLARRLLAIGYTQREVNDRLDLGMPSSTEFGDRRFVETSLIPIDVIDANAARNDRPLPEDMPGDLPNEGRPPEKATTSAVALIKSSDIVRNAFIHRVASKRDVIASRIAGKAKQYYREVRADMLAVVDNTLNKSAEAANAMRDGEGDDNDELALLLLLLFAGVRTGKIPSLWSRIGKEVEAALLIGAKQAFEETGREPVGGTDALRDQFSFYMADRSAFLRGNELNGPLYRAVESELREALAAGESVREIQDRLRGVFNNKHVASHALIGEVESGAINTGRTAAFISVGVKTITWVTKADDKVRDTHASQHMMTIRAGETFPNGCKYPGDPAGRADEIINCRCIPVAGEMDQKELLGL